MEEETPASFDFTAVPAPAPSPALDVEPATAPVIVEEAVSEPAPVPVVVEEVVSEPAPAPAPVPVTRLILPGVPSPTKPFKLRFGFRNKM